MIFLRIPSLVSTYLSISIHFLSGLSNACGVLTHNEVLRRARSLYSISPSSSDDSSPFQLHHAYINDILSRPYTRPAAQAGAFFPDWGYGCFSNDVPAEAAHWPPFIVASIRHFHKTYGPLYIQNDSDDEPIFTKNTLWPNGTFMSEEDQAHKDKLLTFIFSVTLHASSDATWHSLKMYNGFIRMIAGIDFAASYSDAHTLADTAGDIILAHRMDGVPDSKSWVEKTWWIPTADILQIYENMGISTVNRFTFSFCVARGLAAMQALVSAGGAMYDTYAEKSPAMIEFFDEYYLGGLDEMAGTAVWCWRNLTEWMWDSNGGDASDGWDLCDTFKLIKSRNGGKIEPPNPPLLPFSEDGEKNVGNTYTHIGVYNEVIRNQKLRKLVERYEENIYHDEDERLGSEEVFVPDELPYFEDYNEDVGIEGNKVGTPKPTPSPFPGSFTDPLYLSTGKPFSKFGSYLSIGNLGTKQILDGIDIKTAQAESIELTASAFVETEDQDYVAGGAVYSIDLKEILNDQPHPSISLPQLQFLKTTSRSDYTHILSPPSDDKTEKVCHAKGYFDNRKTILEKVKLNDYITNAIPNHPNARFGAATTPVRLKSGVYNVVTAPGPKIFNSSSPKIGFIPAGYLDVFKGPQRILRLSFDDLPGGDRVGEREFGSVVLAADIDSDGEDELVLGMPYADGNRSGCGLQLAEGEVAVVRIGVLVENALKGCDEVVDGAVVRVTLPEWEKKGEDCDQNSYDWFGRSLVWMSKSRTIGVGAPGRGKVYFFKWDDGVGGLVFEYAVWGMKKDGFGGWGLESGVSPTGKEWLAVGAPNDEHQIGHVAIFRILKNEAALVAKVKSKEAEKFGKFGMVLKGDDAEGGLWVSSPFAEGERGAVWWVDIGAIADGDGHWKPTAARAARQVIIGELFSDIFMEYTTAQLLSGSEEKAHFGASLAVVDINGDKKSDLIVGIPFSGVTDKDEGMRFKGAVAVFVRTDEPPTMNGASDQ
ncbi:hypothetical protein TWF694_000812 [Orbilia ellipsospora]|uniref:Phosphatidylinositol-glycan-specific phospholipase D n=1 Tax=Orbilia ellipsospora TaxID=2528407 RepID=A0AAV9XRI0_9PEZI